MSDNNIKALRKQLRNVVQDELAGVLSQEVISNISKQLTVHVDSRLDAIAKHLKDTLDRIDARTTDLQGYVIRQSAPTAPKQD